MLIPSFQLFRAATAALVLIQPPTLVSPPKEGGIFPPTLIQLSSDDGEGEREKVNVGFSVADKVADFCRLQNWHPSTARASDGRH